MTDKELISIVDAEAKKLWNEINTGHEYSIIDSYNQFYGICMEIAEMVQEEPVSEDNNLRKASEEYLKVLSETPYNNTPITNAQTIVRELITFLDNPSKYNPNHIEEHVSEGLEEASKEWLKPQLDKSYAAYGETKQMEFTHFDGYAMLDAIEFGAKWGKNQAMAEIQAQSMALAHGCPEEPASEELIDVAKQYVKEHVIGIDKFTFSIATDMFISGAKWKEHQMMSKAFPVEIDSSRSDGRCILSGNFARFETGDKVKVIVIKED